MNIKLLNNSIKALIIIVSIVGCTHFGKLVKSFQLSKIRYINCNTVYYQTTHTQVPCTNSSKIPFKPKVAYFAKTIS